MPGGNFNGANFKQGLIAAAPMFNAMAAGYASGRGPYAYMDQGAAMIQENMKRKRDEEAAAAAAAAFSGLMTPGGMVPGGLGMAAKGGGFPVSTAPRNPMDPTSISGDTMAALGKDSGTAGYRASLIGTESGGNWRASNNETGAGGKKGHFGRVQFGQARLQEAMNAGAIPQGTTPEQFMNSPALQIAAENWHFADLESKLGDLVGTVVNGKPMDMGALVAMGHLGGAGGARRYVESGGQYNPSDSFGTSLADYAATHGGQPVTMSAKGEATIPTGPVDPMTDPYVQQLMGVMAMPGLTPEQRSVVEMQLQSRIQTITTPNPAAEEDRARARRARDAEILGLRPGTPEFNQYVVTEQLPAKPEPIKIGDMLVDPVTYQPVFDARTPKTPPTPMSAAERQRWGIPDTDPGVYFINDKGEPEKVGGGGVTVNNSIDGGGPELGKLSTDYGYVLDPATGLPKIDPATGLPMAAPVPGSPAAREAEAAAAKTDKRDTQAAATANIVLEDINKAIDQTSGWTAGMGSLLADVPGSGAADLQATIDTIVANIGFDRLQAMREASPTGGALGGIAVPELMMLQAVLGSLKTQQSPPQLKANLERLRQIYEPIAAKAAAYPNAAEFGFVPTSPQGATAPIAGTTSGGVQWSIEP